MRKTFRLLWLYGKLNLSAAMEYRAAFWTQSIGMVINNASFIFFWWIAFGQVGESIGGYTFHDVMFIWGLCSSAFGLAQIVFGNNGHITRMIVTGDLDTYLTQPVDPLFSMLCSRTALSAWGDLAYGVILFIGSGQGLSALPIFCVAVVTGALLMTATNVMLHAMTFFLGDASALGSMTLDFLITFSIYPLGIYPLFMRVLMYTVIPAAFITHVPLKIARDFSAAQTLLLLGFTFAYCAAAWLLFQRGLKRYESGNLIRTRV